MDLRFYFICEGVLREDLELHSLGEAVIDWEAGRPIPGRLTGRFQPVEGVDLLTCPIACRLAGEPLGEYRVSSCVTLDDGAAPIWELTAQDPCLLAARCRLEEPLWAEAGESYLELLHSLLDRCGITKILADDSAATLPTARSWDSGKSLLELINGLLEELGFEALSFDSEGYARLRAYVPPWEAPVRHIYGGEGALLEPELRRTLDVFEAKNVFLVVSDSPEQEQPLRATAVNDDPNSPISTEHLGRILAPTVVVENVADQAALQAIADRLRDQSLLSAEELRFSTAPAVHQPGELLALEHPRWGGLYREEAWRIVEGEERMEHRGRRLFYL